MLAMAMNLIIQNQQYRHDPSLKPVQYGRSGQASCLTRVSGICWGLDGDPSVVKQQLVDHTTCHLLAAVSAGIMSTMKPISDQIESHDNHEFIESTQVSLQAKATTRTWLTITDDFNFTLKAVASMESNLSKHATLTRCLTAKAHNWKLRGQAEQSSRYNDVMGEALWLSLRWQARWPKNLSFDTALVVYLQHQVNQLQQLFNWDGLKPNYLTFTGWLTYVCFTIMTSVSLWVKWQVEA
jgi:hypothetical protein